MLSEPLFYYKTNVSFLTGFTSTRKPEQAAHKIGFLEFLCALIMIISNLIQVRSTNSCVYKMAIFSAITDFNRKSLNFAINT